MHSAEYDIAGWAIVDPAILRGEVPDTPAAREAREWHYNEKFALAVSNPEVRDIRKIRVTLNVDSDLRDFESDLHSTNDSCSLRNLSSSIMTMTCDKLAPGETILVSISVSGGEIRKIDATFRSENFSQNATFSFDDEIRRETRRKIAEPRIE